MDIAKHNFSVSEISSIFKELFNGEIFKNISVYGEVYSIRKGAYTYIEIGDKDKKQDDSPVIICAFYQGYYGVDKIEVGDVILVTGSFSYYDRKSSITLWGKKLEIIQTKLGLSLLKKREILSRLKQDGILDREKKVLPKYVSKIGIITASGSAAYEDIIKTLKYRFPVSTILFPSLVQGSEAAKSLISALNKAYESDVEAIIIGRGGGSKSDLSCFDDEELARTIAKSKVPVITCIGHTIDESICDKVADIHAITPTEGASYINPPIEDVLKEIKQDREKLDDIFIDFIHYLANLLDTSISRLNDLSPSKYISNLTERFNNYNLQLDNYFSNSINQTKNIINQYKNDLNNSYLSKYNEKNALVNNYISKCEIYNPKMIKEKGYIQIFKNKTKLVSKNSLKSKDEVELVFLDGSKEAIIK